MKVIRKVIVIMIIAGLFSSSYASTKDEHSEMSRRICIYVKSTDDYQSRVYKLLNSGYQKVDVIFLDLDNEEIDINDVVVTDLSKHKRELGPIGPIRTYYIKNVRTASDYVGTNRIASVDGPPKTTLSINQTKSVSSTVSATFGATYKLIDAAVGWNVTGSTSISIGGEYTVPKKSGNKRVKRGYLEAYPKYKTKKFDVYYGIEGTNVWTKKGTGIARKAIGVSFETRLTYY